MIEASYLFATPETKIDVLVHPQSVVHSLVEYADGSTLAQLGPPDMRAPIACALAWPDRACRGRRPRPTCRPSAPDLRSPSILSSFPALALARQAWREGGGRPAPR